MDEQVGGRALLQDVRENLPQLRDAMRELPAILRQLGEQASDGRIRFDMQSPELGEIQKQLDEQRRQRYWLTAAATGVIAGTLVLTLGSIPALGWSLLAAGGIAGIAARP
jgi:ferric-dicitrate binding protein FerR (iron transport regulator)